MVGSLVLSSDSRSTAGVILLAIVGVEYGGWFMLRLVRGRQRATGFRGRSSAPATPTPGCW